MSTATEQSTTQLAQGEVAQQQPGQPDQGGPAERERARGAASAAIRELLASAQTDEAEEQAADAPAEPEPEKRPARGKAKAEPEAEAEAPERPAAPPERPLKPSQLEELKRRQRAIERRQAEMEEQGRRIAAERQAIDQARAREDAWERELRANPLDAVAKRLGVAPERLLAGYADGKAQQLDPLVQAELDRLRGELGAERKAREEREAQLREREERVELQNRIDTDVGWFADRVPQSTAADQYPYWSSLPPVERQTRAREAIMLALRYEPDTEKGEILDALEYRAREIYDSFTRSERLQRLRSGATQSNDHGRGKPHGKPTPGTRPSAREAAEPATRSTPHSLEDRRKLAAASIRELNSKRDTG